jgi:Sigma-70 region 2
MQEFAWPGRTAETELAFNLEKAALRREFEQHLEECGTLAYRVARGVLRNAADAEDVAQEACAAISVGVELDAARWPSRRELVCNGPIKWESVQGGGITQHNEVTCVLDYSLLT